MKIAINGFGRIGRMTLRALQNKENVEVVAINDLTDIKTLTHLLKYDSSHGHFPGQVTEDGTNISVNGKNIVLLSEKDPEKLPWKALGIDVVIESTGRFTERDKAQAHINVGAKKVLITATATGGVKTIVSGVNNEIITGDDNIYSTASCTTNAIAPILHILDKEYGIESGYMSTVHAFTADQVLQDAPHRDLRRARAASQSIIPTTTGAAKAIGEVLPNLKGKLDGFSYRVPVVDGHLCCVSVQLREKPGVAAIREAFETFTSLPQQKSLPSAPKNPLIYMEQADRPQPRRDVERENGMAVFVGRLRECPVFDYKFLACGHNTVRGAAGAAVLNAELMYSEGMFD